MWLGALMYADDLFQGSYSLEFLKKFGKCKKNQGFEKSGKNTLDYEKLWKSNKFFNKF